MQRSLQRPNQVYLISALAFVGGVGGGLVFPIIPTLGLTLGLSGFLVGLILSANRISRLIFNVVAGQVFDRIGARRTLIGAFAVLVAGMLLLNVALVSGAPGLWLFIARFVNGIGIAFLMIGAQSALLSGADRAERGRRSGVFRTAFNASLPGGLILGGILADVYSDATAFWAGTLVACIGLALAFLIEPPVSTETGQAPRPRISYRALLAGPNRATLISAAAFNFLVFLTVQGALLATLVVLVQNRSISIHQLEAQGTASLTMALMVTMAALFSIPFGRALDRTARRTTLLFPSVIGMAVGFLCIGLAQDMGLLLVGAALLGLSHNCVMVVAMALIGDGSGEDQHAQSVALFQTAGDIGGTLGPVASLMIATRIGAEALYLGMAAMTLASVVLVLWTRQREMTADIARSG